jgi:hypothetical protein
MKTKQDQEMWIDINLKPSNFYGGNYFMILLIHVVALVSCFSSKLSNISRIQYKFKKTITQMFFNNKFKC